MMLRTNMNTRIGILIFLYCLALGVVATTFAPAKEQPTPDREFWCGKPITK